MSLERANSPEDVFLSAIIDSWKKKNFDFFRKKFGRKSIFAPLHSPERQLSLNTHLTSMYNAPQA